MHFLQSLLANKAITIPVFAWFIAQLIKVIGVIVKEKKLDFTRFIGSGGMPSSHASFIVSLTTVAGKNRGWDSVEFGIAVAVSLIVMYDAAGVRRAAGLQAKVLNELIFSHDHKIHLDKKLKELLGHTPFEVIMGAILGMFLGYTLG
ncbi:MAG: divergent PAP2 family protein [Clostridia bacterium]|nr:divergent PAP2 family protein [Clostridia bacterium]